jgi:hypothetical protein
MAGAKEVERTTRKNASLVVEIGQHNRSDRSGAIILFSWEKTAELGLLCKLSAHINPHTKYSNTLPEDDDGRCLLC